MALPALFRFFPELQKNIPWVSLIPSATPVHKLESFAKSFSYGELYIKREDKTDLVYGGNKVRNLEFVLGEAVRSKKRHILTLAPFGSNFIGAFAVHTKKLNLSAEVEHFVMVKNPQVQAHVDFSRAMGAKLNIHNGATGMVRAAGVALGKIAYSELTHEETLYCPPGASNLMGALGHTNAALELVEQVKYNEMPRPDVVFVGAGTCGTISGLTAGFRLAGWDTRVIGVRCVDKLVCNPRAVTKLSNRVLAVCGSPLRIHPSQVQLTQSPIDIGYAKPLEGAEQVMQRFYEHEGIHLDTTYTSKVVAKMDVLYISGALKDKKVLYWHTFSPAAMIWAQAEQARVRGLAV